MSAVETLLHKASKKPKGKMQIKKRHVDKLPGSNSQSRAIGKPRANIIWGCVAELISSRQHNNGDMSLTTNHLELRRARGIAALEDGAKGKSHRVGLRGSVTTWFNDGGQGASGGAALFAASGEDGPVEGLEAADVEHERPQVNADGDADTARVGRDRDAPTHAEHG